MIKILELYFLQEQVLIKREFILFAPEEIKALEEDIRKAKHDLKVRGFVSPD